MTFSDSQTVTNYKNLMVNIQHFPEISDYLKTSKLKIESKLPDFLVYSWEQANHQQMTTAIMPGI
jgi:hypothetical protein